MSGVDPATSALLRPAAAVIGSGAWGTTFASLLAQAGTPTTIWARRREVAEEIKLLNTISHVSARLARNLSILAASKSEEGGKTNVKDGRNGTDHRRAPNRCCFY